MKRLLLIMACLCVLLTGCVSEPSGYGTGSGSVDAHINLDPYNTFDGIGSAID